MATKNMLFIVSGLALVLGPSLTWAADDTATQPSPSAAASAPASNMGTNPNSSATASPAVQAPPTDWKKLTGMVQAVDSTAKTVQIKDDSGNVLQVPVDRQVKIEKEGKRVRLTQLQTGDVITLAKRTSPSPDNSGTRSY